MSRKTDFAVANGLTVFCLGFLIQAENAWHVLDLRHFLAVLVFGQVQSLAVALLVGAFTWKFADPPYLRKLALFVVFCIGIFLSLNSIVYSIFNEHISLALSEGSVPNLKPLWSSLTAEIDARFFFHLICAFLFPLLFAAKINLSKKRVTRKKIALGLGAFGLYAIISTVILQQYDFKNLGWHPLLRMIASLRQNTIQDKTSCSQTIEPQISSPIDYRKPDFTTLAAHLKLAEQPNIILIVLESVGSLQALKAPGLETPDSARMPELARFSQNALIFNRMINTFPATIRTHVPLMTGGRTITWGSVFNELKSKYLGSTLVGQLNSAGYRTFLFSSQGLSAESMNSFYKNLGFDIFFDPEETPDREISTKTINSWGIDEQYVFKKARDWADSDTEPFFLEFLSVGTHHPYSVPRSAPEAFGNKTAKDRYLNALHYSDSIVGQWLKWAQDRKGRRTIVVVMGDHGESFEEFHPGNWVHKNALYEENIRNFLWIWDPKTIQNPQSSDAIISIGDVAPTLLQMAHIQPGDMVGRSLLGKETPSKIQYFHKNAPPEQWGLQNGRWKYIAHRFGEHPPELYDLMTDPHEQKNLAPQYADAVQQYECWIQKWYINTNNDFVSRLRGFQYLAHGLKEEDLKIKGPKLIRFGRFTNQNEFEPRAEFDVMDKVVVMTDWINDWAEKDLLYVWTSPQGKVEATAFHMKSDWTRTWVNRPDNLPLEPGTWKLKIIHPEFDRTLITGEFRVRSR